MYSAMSTKLVTILVSTLLLINFNLSAQTSIYVAPYGNNANSGNCDAPVATLQQAVVLSRSTGIKSILIYKGRYHFNETVNLDAQDAGLSISAYEDDQVIFDGGLNIEANLFSPVTTNLGGRIKNSVVNNIYAAQISDVQLVAILAQSKAKLSFNDKAINIARYPNEGTVVFTEDDLISSIESVRTDGTHANPVGGAFEMVSAFQINNAAWEAEIQRHQKAEITGYHSSPWLKEYNLLASVQYNNNHIRMVNGSAYGIDNIKGRGFTYFTNILYELDSPGEWFFDEIDNILYLYPLGTFTDESLISLYAGPELINIKNTANITVENLTIQNIFGNGVNGLGAIDVRCSDNVHIAGITFKNIDIASFNFWSDVTNSGAKSCDLIDAGGSRLYGGSFSNNHVTHGNNYIENCHYTKIYAKDEYGKFCGIAGAGQIFKNNLCHNTNGQPLTFRGIDHTLEKNEFFNTGVEEGDGGAFYTGNQMWNNGSIIKNNFFHHIMSLIGNVVPRAAVHLDDNTCGVDVIENMFYRAGRGVHGHGGAHRTIGNIAIKNWLGFRAFIREAGDPLLISNYADNMAELQNDPLSSKKENYIGRALQVTGVDGWEVGVNSTNWINRFSPFWLNRYPAYGPMMTAYFNGKEMLPYQYEFKNNFYFDNESNDFWMSSVVDQQNNNQTNLSIFKDPATLNFNYNGTQPSDAPNIPFDLIGLYTDQYRCAIPQKAIYRKAVNDYFANRKVHNEPLNYNTRNALTYYNSGLAVYSTIPCSDVIVVDSVPNSYHFDFGTASSPVGNPGVAAGTYTQITPTTNKLNYGWVTNNNVNATDRGGNSGANEINRDFVFSSEPNIFEAKVSNGNWLVMINISDTQTSFDNIQVKAEGKIIFTDINITPSAGFEASKVIDVTDGRLSLEFSDLGGIEPNWLINRVVLTKTNALAECDINCEGEIIDSDNDGICNTNDSCPVLEQSLIGTSCNDDNPCTIDDVYTTTCECIGILNGVQPVSGLARDIGYGGGKIFIVGNNNQIYQYNPCNQNWDLFSSSPLAKRIDVDGLGNPWIIATNNTIYKWDATSFVKLPGEGIDIGINLTQVGIIGTNKKIYKWDGSNWNMLDFSYPNMRKIAMTSTGFARSVGEDNILYWEQSGGVFPKGNFTCEDVGIKEGATSSYVLSNNGNIYTYVGGGNYALVLENGGGINFTISSDDDFWLTQASLNIKLSENCKVQKRFEIVTNHQARDIGTGGAKTFIVGSDRKIYQYNNCNNVWNLFSSAPLVERIDVDGNGHPWIIATDNTIHQWTGNGFAKLPGLGIDIGVNDNKIGVIGTDNKIYKWNGTNWDLLNFNYPDMSRIDMTANGYARVVSTAGISYWDQGTGVFPKGDFKIKDVSTTNKANSGFVLSDNGSIYTYIGGGNYELVGGYNGANFTISNTGDIWIGQQNSAVSLNRNCSISPCLPCSICNDGVPNACNDCVEYIIEDQNLHSTQSHAAYIGLESNLIISSGTSVCYTGGEYILMEDGFEVKSNTDFKAQIKNCNLTD